MEIPASGTLVYSCSLGIDSVTEFGTSLDQVLSGEPLPASGVRLDVHVSGLVEGGLLNGHLSAIDYVYVRADGSINMHVHGRITTRDGAHLSVSIDGIMTLRPGDEILDLRENVQFFSTDERYSWLNGLQVWGEGMADMVNQKVIVKTRVA